MAMPVRPSSAAFLNVACGKCPVSSSSLASGRTSDSANSRTVFWRRDCSSVRSRFMGGSSLAQKVEKDLHRGRGGHGEEKSRLLASLGMTAFRMTLGGQGFAEALIGDAEVFGVNAGFSGDGHEIGIAEPAREGVEVEMADDACACGAAEVHAEIHAVRLVICLEGFFHALGQMHHFAEGIAIAQIQFGDVSVGNDHDVAGGVREAVEDDENLRAAIDDERVLIVLPGGGVAKNAVGLFPRHDLRHVRIAPGGPEIVHREGSSKSKSCAHSIAQNGVRVARASTRAQEVSGNSQIRFCEGKEIYLRVLRVAGSCSCRCRCFGAVHKILELLAGLEERDFLWRNFDLLARLGIAAHAAAALARAEAAEAADFDFVAALEGLDDAVKNRLDDGLGLLAGEFRNAQDLFDEVGLRQRQLLGHLAYASLQSQCISSRRFLVRNGLEGRDSPGCPSSYH